MARSLRKSKGRAESGSFIQLPHAMLESEEYASLSAHAVKALVDLFSQYRGHNNGDYSAAWSLMSKRGWTSKALLYRALNELQAKGWIDKTRQGWKHRTSLYAVTWKPIDECNGKLDVKPTRTASGAWKQHQNQNGGPPVGHIGPTAVPISKSANAN